MAFDTLKSALRPWLAKLPIRRFRDPAPVVNLIRLSGVIGKIGPLRSGLTLEGLEKSFERAFGGDPKAVAISVNSPGGSPVQSALIARRLRQLSDEKKIPVVAFVEDVAASGGYWLACAGDDIYAEGGSIVGSIGVVSAGFGFPRFLELIRVERRVHASGARKAMLDPFRDEDPSDVERLKDIQIEIHDQFKDYVRARRGGRLTAADEDVFEGDIWTGMRAVEFGLIDGLGDVRTIMRERFGERVRIREISTDGAGFLRRKLGFAGSHRAAADLAPGLIAALDEWAQWKRFGL